MDRHYTVKDDNGNVLSECTLYEKTLKNYSEEENKDLNISLIEENFKNMIHLNNGLISDGDHSFDELYHHRAILTASLFNTVYKTLNIDSDIILWKSRHHDDGSMFDNYFIVGLTIEDINSVEKSATYHYPLKYWDLFHIMEIDNAPKYDGHTPKDAINLLEKIFCHI